MAQQVRNVTNIIINDRVAALSAGSVDTLNAGEIGVFAADGTRMTTVAAATATSFFLARGSTTGSADGYWKSDLINVADLTPATTVAVPVAAAEQHDTIGYDGTSGSLEAINNNLYLVTIYVQELLTSSTDGRYIKHFQYKSDASATQAEIAIGLAGSAIQNFSKEAEQYIAFKALCSSAVTAANDFVNDITLVKGSKVVSVATAVTWGPGATTLAVGDFVRMGAAGAGTALTDDVYRVTAVDTTNLNFTVDRPMQVASQVLAAGTSDAEVITGALGAAADWGIDMLGLPLTYSVGKFFYNKARWVVGIKDFGTSTSANVAMASKGVGDGQEISDTEWFCAGFEGEYFRMGEPAIYNFSGVAVTTETYAMIGISFQDKSLVGFTDNISPKLLLAAIPTDIGGGNTPANAVTGTANSLTAVLDAIPGIPTLTLT